MHGAPASLYFSSFDIDISFRPAIFLVIELILPEHTRVHKADTQTPAPQGQWWTLLVCRDCALRVEDHPI